jgi:hypothetical protein
MCQSIIESDNGFKFEVERWLCEGRACCVSVRLFTTARAANDELVNETGDYFRLFQARQMSDTGQFPVPDPQVSVMTDDVIEGRISENSFRRAITTLAGARVLGTLCAQAVLVPAALIIVRIADLI